MKTRSFTLFGYQIDVYNFGYATYMYPTFNGNAEFPVTKKGYKQLVSYLKDLIWINNIISQR